MPYTATSLGRWMKPHTRADLACTVSYSPLRDHHGPPRGCFRALKNEYAFRYGVLRNETMPDGMLARRLRSGLVTNGSGLFAFPPHWARRLPHLVEEHEKSDMVATLETIPPGTSAAPGFEPSRPSGMHTMYQEANDDLDYWSGGSCCAPTRIWVRYWMTDELKEVYGVRWRKLYAPDLENFIATGVMPVRSFPEERLSTARNFPTPIYVRDEDLRVLGSSHEELADVYHFFIFKPNSHVVVVVDRRCNVIVALVAGKTRL